MKCVRNCMYPVNGEKPSAEQTYCHLGATRETTEENNDQLVGHPTPHRSLCRWPSAHVARRSGGASHGGTTSRPDQRRKGAKMLYYIQMRWNVEGRLSKEETFELEWEEARYKMNADELGKVKALYKVVGQRRIIGVVDVDGPEELDRMTMGGLPMAHFLEFEQVWALRDFDEFAADVEVGYRIEGYTAEDTEVVRKLADRR